MPFEAKLIRACIELNYNNVCEAIAEGADVNCVFTASQMANMDKSYKNLTTNQTPLRVITARTLALENQSDSKDLYDNGLKIISLLLKRSRDITGNDPGSTLLHEILQNGCNDVVEVFIKNMPLLATKKDKDGNTPLHIACNPNADNIFKSLINVGLLIRYGTSVINEQNNLSQTPLIIAADYAKNDPCIAMRHEIITLLVKKDADLSKSDVYGNTVITLAADKPKLREAIQNGGYNQPFPKSPAKKSESPRYQQSSKTKALSNTPTSPTNTSYASGSNSDSKARKKLF